ncbi:hypothetical protein JR316_0007302 [Psilocybe cubensis]|nr:hypothetical protein JR316_0007302 [Psilocybe cubensis]KAH9480702.1 hypothetical protein JR316_0007302 [Psilocybe cubensis]
MQIITQSGSKISYLKLRGYEFPEKLSNARSLERNFLVPFISETLTTLDVSRILDLPMSLIANSANLKHLHLHYTAPELYHDGVDEDLLKAFPNIQTLEIRPPDAMIGLLLGHDGFPETRSATVYAVMTFCGVDSPAVADITSLKSFRTFNTPYYLTLAQAIIDKAKVSLEEFYLCGESDEEFCQLVNSINLCELSRLQRLYMDIVLPIDVDAIRDLSSVLLTVPDNNSLQHISLQVFNGQYNRRSVPESINSPSWSLLDSQVAIIAQERPFTFHLHICHQPAEFSDSESDSDGFERCTVTRTPSSRNDEPESIIRLRACRSEREHEALLHKMCKSVYRTLLLENMPKIMQSPNITVVSTYSIRTPYHYWAPRERHVKNIL